MIIDMSFETREEARKFNLHCIQHWKYAGTAYDEKGNGYIAWRTNTKNHIKKLLRREGLLYKDFSKVIMDKGEQQK